jgi:hypothetical protein
VISGSIAGSKAKINPKVGFPIEINAILGKAHQANSNLLYSDKF